MPTNHLHRRTLVVVGSRRLLCYKTHKPVCHRSIHGDEGDGDSPAEGHRYTEETRLVPGLSLVELQIGLSMALSTTTRSMYITARTQLNKYSECCQYDIMIDILCCYCSTDTGNSSSLDLCCKCKLNADVLRIRTDEVLCR